MLVRTIVAETFGTITEFHTGNNLSQKRKLYKLKQSSHGNIND